MSKRKILDDEISEGTELEEIVHEERRKHSRTEKKEVEKRGKEGSKKRVAIWVKDEVLRYESELKDLQIELLKMQNYIKDTGQKVLMIFEGRDAAGKAARLSVLPNILTLVVLALSLLINQVT